MKTCAILSLFGLMIVAGAALALVAPDPGEEPVFRGELRLTPGHHERVAVRANMEGRASSRPPLPEQTIPNARVAGMQYAIRGEAISFADPAAAETWIDPSEFYDALFLPFQVELGKMKMFTQPQVLTQLKISGPESEQTEVISEGMDLPFAGTALHVEAIRPWFGLLRHPLGTSMASAALRPQNGAWTENIFLEADTWRTLEPGMGLYLAWHATQEEAEAAAAKGPPGIEMARWGALDGGAVNWFGSFTPGTGTTLRDGTRIELLHVDERHSFGDNLAPAIQVRVSGPSGTGSAGILAGGAEEILWARANANPGMERRAPESTSSTKSTSPPRPPLDALIRFEYPGSLDTLFMLHAWMDGRAIVCAVQRGQSAGMAPLTEGDAWQAPGLPYELRLDQTLATAFVVSAKDSPLHEAVLRDGRHTLRLREGETVTWKEQRIAFVRQVTLPLMHYELRIVRNDSGVGQDLSLGPDEELRVGGFRLRQGTPDLKHPDIAVLELSPEPRRARHHAGVVLAALGSAGLLLMLIRARGNLKSSVLY